MIYLTYNCRSPLLHEWHFNLVIFLVDENEVMVTDNNYGTKIPSCFTTHKRRAVTKCSSLIASTIKPHEIDAIVVIHSANDYGTVPVELFVHMRISVAASRSNTVRWSSIQPSAHGYVGGFNANCSSETTFGLSGNIPIRLKPATTFRGVRARIIALAVRRQKS